MSLIHCTCDCLFQEDGYCKLEKAAQVTSSESTAGCLHYQEKNKTLGQKDHMQKELD